MNEQTVEKLQELLRLALSARYGDEPSRRYMRDECGVIDKAELSGIAKGIGIAIQLLEREGY